VLLARAPSLLEVPELARDRSHEAPGIADRLHREARLPQRVLDRARIAHGLVDLGIELGELALQPFHDAPRALRRDLPAPQRLRRVALRLLGRAEDAVRVAEGGNGTAGDGLHGLVADGAGRARLQVAAQLVGRVPANELLPRALRLLPLAPRVLRGLLERGHRGVRFRRVLPLRGDRRPLLRARLPEPIPPAGDRDELLRHRLRGQEDSVPVRVEGDGGERRLVGLALLLEPRALRVGLAERLLRGPRALLLGETVGLPLVAVAPGLPHAAGEIETLAKRLLPAAEALAVALRAREVGAQGFQALGRRVGVLRGELPGDELGLLPGLRRPPVGERVHLLVDLQVQERDQDLAPLVRPPLEERVELALGQHDRAREGVVVEADDLPHLLVDLARPVGERFPSLAVPALEARLGRTSAGPGGPHDAVRPLPHLELEVHGDALRPVADELAVLLRHPRHLAVEREHERVDERGLAGPRRARDREEVEGLQVERQLLLEGGEALDLQPAGPHPCASSYRAWKSRASSGAGAAPFLRS
jgi:hypothetical protein